MESIKYSDVFLSLGFVYGVPALAAYFYGMKHFEELWVEAESFQKKGPPIERMRKIREMIKNCEDNPPENREETDEFMSALLFELTGLSKDMNINVAAALNAAITDKKIDTYG